MQKNVQTPDQCLSVAKVTFKVLMENPAYLIALVAAVAENVLDPQGASVKLDGAEHIAIAPVLKGRMASAAPNLARVPMKLTVTQ